MQQTMRSRVHRLTLVMATCSAFLLASCSILPRHGGRVEGKVWCNARYLPGISEFESQKFKAIGDRYDVALRGYPYALAAALTLQSDGATENAFRPPLNLEHQKERDVGGPTGFFASTYLYDRNDHPPEVIVAFRGTNDSRDWFLHNLSFRPEQFAPARAYVLETAARYPDRRLVVTGFSLGGGLASHVTLRPETRDKVAEAWLFNPSPRNGVHDVTDPRIWMAAVQGEFLNLIRSGTSGAEPGQYSNRFDLVRSSSIFGHYRFVLTREMLHFADLTEYVRGNRTARTTEALDILQMADERHCDKQQIPASPEAEGDTSSGDEGE